jgi:hypothetical protein
MHLTRLDGSAILASLGSAETDRLDLVAPRSLPSYLRAPRSFRDPSLLCIMIATSIFAAVYTHVHDTGSPDRRLKSSSVRGDRRVKLPVLGIEARETCMRDPLKKSYYGRNQLKVL